MENGHQTLSDIRVLDLSQGVAGPYCAKLLAGLGAEVVKVEPPGGGDVSRGLGPFLEGASGTRQSALFLYLNTAKKGVTLDLENPASRDTMHGLVQDSDILIESFPPGFLEGLNLGYPSLSKINPGLIHTSITAFGQWGPYRDYQGSDIVAQAVGALMCTVGLPDREPLKIGGETALYTTGVSAFSATMIALHVRDARGFGQQVDVSSMETIAVAQIHSSIHHQFGRVPTRRESNLVPAKDGWVSPGLETGAPEGTWPKVCGLMGVPELADDPRFNTAAARRQNQQELQEVVGRWAGSLPKEEIYHTLQGMRTITGYVATVEDLAKSRQLAFRDFFQLIEEPPGVEGAYPGHPIKIDGESRSQVRAPRLGEHNQEIFCGRLGLSPGELAGLVSQGAV
jgi:crotonobetainyl-CoA:carnitine CoA-transferase CaiB-like acyl-CoA transferase